MDAGLMEWLNLAIRWLHVVTAMAWIGASFYFNWLDSHLTPPSPPRKGVEGELWMVHSGGFYQVEKIHVAPEELPAVLHWFKWEAAFTWMSGALLLVLVYYLGADIYLVDPAVADIPPAAGIAIGVASLALGWLVYDGIWISPLGQRRPGLAAALSVLLFSATAVALCHLLSGRAAFLHAGALLGTIMAANVWMRIIPAQRRLVAATRAGTRPDAAGALGAKQRSVHNNYMTLPVVFAMLSGHYPGTFAHPLNWLILILLSLIGAGVRHYFNLRNRGRDRPWILGAAAAAGIGLFLLAARPQATGGAAAAPVAFAEVSSIVGEHCTSCHSMRPTDEAFEAPPKGVAFDSPQSIRRHAAGIGAQAVASAAMPLGNKTGMTAAERELLGRWIAQGAPLR